MTSADLLSWLLTYAAHSSLLLGLAWLVSRQAQSHAVKDVLWKTALIGGMFTASLQRANWAPGSLGAWAVRLELPATEAPRAVATTHVRAPIRTTAPKAVLQTTAPDRVESVAAEAAPASAVPEAAPSARSTSPTPLILVWAAIAAVLVLRFVAARWRLAVGFGRRRPVTDPSLTAMLTTLRQEAGIRRAIHLTRASGLSSPVAFGYSEICLPDAVLTDLEPEQQHSVLAHELAHLARFDPLWLDLSGVLERLFFFQPLNRLARYRIQDSAEYLCDDWAVRRTGSGLTLAKCLVKVAEWMEASPRAVPVSGMAEHRSQLVSRIHRLIGNHAMRTGPRPRWLLPAAALLLVTTAAIAPGFVSSSYNAQAQQPVQDTSRAAKPVTAAAMESDLRTTSARLAELRLHSQLDAARAGSRVLTTTQMRAMEAQTQTLQTLSRIRENTLPAVAMSMDQQARAELRRAGRGQGDTTNAAVPALLAALKDPEVAVRRAAAQSLANLEDIRTVPGLIEALKDADKEVRASAAGGLGNLRDERAVDGLILLLKDPDPEVRAAAVSALGELHSAKAVPGLTAALHDDSKDVRRGAISALGDMDNPRPVDALIGALKDTDPEVRQSAANALGSAEDKRAVRPLMALLTDPVADVRQASADALGSLQATEAAEPLATLLRDSNSDVREAAAGALGQLELKLAPQALLDALKDPNHDVRQRAASTAGQIQDPRAVPLLTALLADTDADVRESAVDALSEIQDRTALDALIGALKSKDANVRKRAAEALGHREN